MQLYQGDCLELMKEIPDGSVDLVLCDPPYGIMNGAPIDSWKRRDDLCEWDSKTLPTLEIFSAISRILRQNGKCLLFSQEPYTSQLITNAIASLPFSYRAIWLKKVSGNSLMANKAMVSKCEDICLFSKLGHDYSGENPLRDYFKCIQKFIGKTKKQIIDDIGQCVDHCFRTDSTQYALCTAKTYQKLIITYSIDKMDGFIEYAKLRQVQDDYVNKYSSTFNLWQGNKSKSNVLEYSKDNDGYHPTQKPVALLEDLIQTFSNEGDTVLDFTMGSGSTGVACVNTGRDFIGIELDPHYFEVAQQRIQSAQS